MSAEDPNLTLDDAMEKLSSAWSIVDQNIGWFKDSQLESAKDMLRKFFEWQRKNKRILIATEEPFEIQVGRAIVKGSVDRLEQSGDALFVVDLKTGKSATAKNDALTHKQLQAYQLAILEGGFDRVSKLTESAGAGLLFVGNDAKSASEREQPPVNHDEISKSVSDAAEGMGADRFTATLNKNCRTCSVKLICPLQADGRSVIE
jgi:RecB family exonuclease